MILFMMIFILASFLGYELIRKVPSALHTPLMSGSNAISGISILGAISVSGSDIILVKILAVIALILATMNVVGGYLVTHRMLRMFRKDKT